MINFIDFQIKNDYNYVQVYFNLYLILLFFIIHFFRKEVKLYDRQNGRNDIRTTI